MRVLGIDPGSETTGWGVVEGDERGRKYRLVEFGALRLSPSASFPSRLLKISRGLEEIITRMKPDACAIEDAFYANNPKVTLKLGQVRGIVLLAAESAALEISDEYVWLYTESPKWWTSSGKADKLPKVYEDAVRRARAP